MATSEQIAARADMVLAAIKTPGTDKARVRELQLEYASLTRQYEASARAAWDSAPLGPVSA